MHVRRAASAEVVAEQQRVPPVRARPGAAAAYAQAKTALARHAPDDWDLYYDVKDPVCDIIMAGADDWAVSTGWRVEQYP
jgi:GrpB-like predicted nucleotidyltransferase (UPF0157 family)